MQRINAGNARADINGQGKTGFSDNTDLQGQDATYLTPEWCNHLQEEIATVIEAVGITLNTSQQDQLDTAIKILISNSVNALSNRVTSIENANNQLDAAQAQALIDLNSALELNRLSDVAQTGVINAIQGLVASTQSAITLERTDRTTAITAEANERFSEVNNLQEQINGLRHAYPKIIAAGAFSTTADTFVGYGDGSIGTKFSSTGATAGVTHYRDPNNSDSVLVDYSAITTTSADRTKYLVRCFRSRNYEAMPVDLANHQIRITNDVGQSNSPEWFEWQILQYHDRF